MISEFQAAYAALKSTKEMLSVVLDAKIDSVAKEKVNEALKRLGEIQDTLFATREKLYELQEENQNLKKAIAELQDFNDRISQYSLQETPGGAVVYLFDHEPKHYVCPSCVESKKELHILQDNRNMSRTFTCPACKHVYRIKRPDNSSSILSIG